VIGLQDKTCKSLLFVLLFQCDDKNGAAGGKLSRVPFEGFHQLPPFFIFKLFYYRK
jgi:hypothetical protein